MNTNVPTVNVLGSKVHMIELQDVVRKIVGWIQQEEGGCHQVVVTGFHGIWEAHRDPEFKAMLNSADLWVPDGIAPVWVARWQGIPQPYRITGADIMKAVFERSNEKGYSSFFYGDTDETLASLSETVEHEYPGHRVAGTFSPPFAPLTPEEDETIIKMINDAKPDVLWVGLGLPKQERWIFEHRDRLSVPVVIGVGAAFRFLSGRVSRVPAVIGDLGFEWLWRFIQEPKKLWRRAMVQGPQFVGHVLLELSGLRSYE